MPIAFVFTEPCMSFFLFVIIFTLILCKQADVFDGVIWGQIWVPFHCNCPVFDVIFWSSSSLTLTPAHLTLMSFEKAFFLKCFPEWGPTAPLSSLQFGCSQFHPPLFSFYTFQLNVLWFVFRCGVLWFVYPLMSNMIRETRDTHPPNTHLGPLFLCLRYHQYQHHHRGHCWLHPLPRPHTGCYSLVLQVSVFVACT